ncbi:MAG: sulfotransferase family protein [Planctomycetota bacterium]|jgi:hypothetical protein
MLNTVKPWLRTLKYGYLRWHAERLAHRPAGDDSVPDPAPMAFIFGCGRSGTTMLGGLFSKHPEVCYLRIEPETDCFNLYHRIDGRCLMDAAHAEPEIRVRFARVMLSTLRRSGRKLLVEKTPINALRIGFLEALAPRARYVHIVRDGVDVCRSIERVATRSAYKMGGKPTMNQWWAVDNVKWDALLRDGAAAGYHADEARRLQGHLAMGAYEWIVSLLEVDRKREALGDRLLEIRYPDLTAEPAPELENVCRFLQLPAPTSWLEEAAKVVGPARHHEGPAVILPESMCRTFNAYQERFGFANRADPGPPAE